MLLQQPNTHELSCVVHGICDRTPLLPVTTVTGTQVSLLKAGTTAMSYAIIALTTILLSYTQLVYMKVIIRSSSEHSEHTTCNTLKSATALTDRATLTGSVALAESLNHDSKNKYFELKTRGAAAPTRNTCSLRLLLCHSQ